MSKDNKSGKLVKADGKSVEDKRFRKLIENSLDGLTLLDKDLHIIYRSRSAERINGWSAADRAKYDMGDLVHPDDREYVMSILRQVLSKPGLSITCNFRSRHFNGHYIWLECAYTNLFDDPDVNAIVCNFRDVSEKKYAEELLQQTVKELFDYKYALEESAIVAITDQKGIIRHVNENFCRISKYSAAELIGHDHRIINSGYHDKGFIRDLWVTIANGKIWKGELKNKAKDGSYYWVDTTIVPFLDEGGKPYQYVAIRSDITGRKLAQEKIIESDLFTKTITDNLPALIAYWSADQRCLFANKPYMDWFEKEPHEMLGIDKRELLDKEEFALHELHIKKVLSGIPQRFERTFHKANGKTIQTDTQYLPDKEGEKVKGFYSLIYDVTEIKLAEMELKKKNEQIEDILENLTDGFIALDENRCYTYANKQVGVLIATDPKELIGKNIWEVFPDAVGSATYQAIETALNEKTYVCNEDHYAPLNLWQENRAYPTGNGISVFIRDITRGKHEEQHLKLLESVITHTTEAVLITEAEPLDEPGPRIVYVNDAFTKMTGYTAEELVGRTPRVLQGANSDKSELKRLSENMRMGRSCEITTINYKKNGEEFWINFAVSPVTNNEGALTHFIAIERDVTEQKKEEQQKLALAEAVVEALEEKNTILESIDDAFFAVDKNWIVTYWNKAAENIFGKSRSRIVNNNLLEEFPYMVDTAAYKYYCQVLDTGRSAHFEYYSTHYNLWLDANVYPGTNGFTVYMKNITARKNAESLAMAALEERNTILESIDDAFFAVDKNWTVTYWNNMAEKVLQTPKDKILNRHLWEAFADSIGSESYRKYHEAAESGQAVHFEDYYQALQKWYEISAYPSNTGLSVYFKDVTDRKLSDMQLRELNEALQKHAKELAISNAELEQFAYVASHDLQEPLRMVTSFLSQLEKKYSDILDERGRQYINFAVDGAKRMRQIILDLLDFSRVGRAEDDLEVVDFNKLVNEILGLYRRQIEELQGSVDFENLPIFQTYKTPIRQVFQNLIGNSLKYHSADKAPMISIRCKETKTYFQFSVKDNGIGIAPEYFDKIFIIFQRLHNKDKYSGTGMGLAMAKKIIENLGGKIWVKSEEGKGSTFYFTLLKT